MTAAGGMVPILCWDPIPKQQFALDIIGYQQIKDFSNSRRYSKLKSTLKCIKVKLFNWEFKELIKRRRP